MPTTARISTGHTVFEDGYAVLVARVRNLANALITQASVESVSVKVFDPDGEQVGDELTPAVADSVFDALQTDLGNVPDATGYNVKLELGPTALPTGGVTYRVEVWIATTDDRGVALVWSLTTLPLHRS